MAKVLKYTSGILGAFGLFVSGVSAQTSYVATTTSALEGAVDDIAEIIFGVLPYAIGFIAALMGFMFVWRWLKNRIGSPRG